MRRGKRLIQRLGMACAVAVGGGFTAGCVKTANFLDAALMRPVLVEDFETPPAEQASTYHAGQTLTTAATRWDVTAGRLEQFNAKTRPGIAAFDGEQAVHLAASSVLATDFPTTPKRQYTVTFHYARPHHAAAAAGRARVEVLSETTTLMQAEVSHDGVASDAYRRYSGIFTAESQRTMLRFSALAPESGGITLDGISIRAVPRPPPLPPPRAQ
jgi:hypothetical protein